MVDYYGFTKELKFRDKYGENLGGAIKIQFKLGNRIKPTSSMFIGLSPELEIALYTLAIMFESSRNFKVSLGGKIIKLHAQEKNGNLVTAFPIL